LIGQGSIEEQRSWKTSFFTIWIGQAFSLLGSQLVQFALIWYLTVQTESATVLATVTMVAMLPGVFLSPFIGPLVDRWNRRWIMAAADAGIALATVILALLFAFDYIQIWHIYALTLIRAIGGNFHRPSMTASTSLMVPRKHLARIQGVNQTLNGGLNIIAAPLGAVLLEQLPMQGILAIDVVTAIIAISSLFFIRIPQPERSPEEQAAKPSMLSDMAAGFRYVTSWSGLMIFAFMAAMINFLLAPANSLMPLLVKDHFGGGAMQLGWMSSIFGVGVIVGGLMLSVWGGFKRQIITALIGMIGIGLGTLTAGLAPASAFYLALAGMAVAGFMMPITNGSAGAILQATVDPNMQGRVFTLTGSLSTAMMPIGLAFAGPLSDWLGIQTWFLIGGGACILMGFAGFVIPAVMNIEERER